MWTNHLPVGTAVSVNSVNKKLQALAFTEDCIGVVKLMEIMTDIDPLPTKIREDLLKSFYWIGMGVLNPSMACAICGGDFA